MVTSSRSQATKKPCYLLALPPELRNRIWTYALAPAKPFVLPDQLKFGTTGRAVSHHAQQPALAQTSYQLRSETLPMFYNLNTFTVHGSSARGCTQSARIWLAGIDSNAAHLRSVHLHLDRRALHIEVVRDSGMAPFIPMCRYKDYRPMAGYRRGHNETVAESLTALRSEITSSLASLEGKQLALNAWCEIIVHADRFLNDAQ